MDNILTLLVSSALYVTSTAFSPVAPADHKAFTQVLPQADFVSYIVKKDEALTDISQKYYGSDLYWTTIWNDNEQISDAEHISEGTMIKLRPVKPAQPAELEEKLQKIQKDLSEKKNTQYLQSIGYLPKEQNFKEDIVPTDMPQVTQAQAAPVQTAPSSYEAVYKEAGAKYGVPWQVLYGLHITETGGRDGAISNHSGSGAQGPMQFMPGTWRAYGADGNGDGVADINNAVDAINGAANYLAKHGSLDQGLRAYGGNYSGVLAIAKSAGFNQ